MTTMTYLPAPVKIENNRINKTPDLFLRAGCSVALGILSYYAPKTFLATSVGIFAYQIHRFNQLVQTADSTKHQQIHVWAIKACMVMYSIGAVFMIKSLPYFWSAAKDLRHLQLIHCVGHLAKGFIISKVGGCLASPFNNSVYGLTFCRRKWVEMEDYVTNYPAEVKEGILSEYRNQIWFYICALLPQIGLATHLSRHSFPLSQFQPEDKKLSILQNYFKNINMKQWQWPLAVHQFQQLSTENQLAIGPQLAAFGLTFSEEEQNQFPDDVKAVILNETLKDFGQVPNETNSDYPKWQAFCTAFERLPREQQSILSEELLRLVQTLPQESIDHYFSGTMKLAALKASTRNYHIENMQTLADFILNSLTESFKEEFRLFQENDIKLMQNLTQHLLSV